MNFERETAHFGRSPVALVDDLVNCLSDYTADTMDACENVLKTTKSMKDREKQIEEVRFELLLFVLLTLDLGHGEDFQASAGFCREKQRQNGALRPEQSLQDS
jgi:hypothetical protein